MSFFLGAFPLLTLVSPLVGLALGIVDVQLSRLVMARMDPASLELYMDKIQRAQAPYRGAGNVAFLRSALYVLGEEAIRGAVVTLASRAGWTAALLTGTLAFFMARPLPWPLKLPKLLDDLVLTLLFLYGGVLAAWLAHAALNAYIIAPLARGHGGGA